MASAIHPGASIHHPEILPLIYRCRSLFASEQLFFRGLFLGLRFGLRRAALHLVFLTGKREAFKIGYSANSNILRHVIDLAVFPVAQFVDIVVVDAGGKIVESAILEIRDVAGRPVRAVKTNKVGHFLIVTPLQNGKYEIISEKEGLNFETVTFEATGSIVPPIAIRARNNIPTPIIIN